MVRRKAGGTVLFLVVRVGWREWYTGGYEWFRGNEGACRSSGRPVAAYADRARAEAHCAELEAEARTHLSPFNFLEPHWMEDFSTLSREEFEQQILAVVPGTSLPSKPERRERDWAKWWDDLVDRLSDEQREAVWGLFDQLHFYAVVETALEEA
jgi:hypothetical protein